MRRSGIVTITGQPPHGKVVPKLLAKAGAWAQQKLEPIVPDAIDQGEMADDHYALDISRARRLLGWAPRHRLQDELPKLVEALKNDPIGWYEANKVTPPPWLGAAKEVGEHPEALRVRHAAQYRREHQRHRWAPIANILLGAWLATSPPLIGLGDPALAWSDVVSGSALILLAALALSERHGWARWACAAIGVWVMSAPFLFWTPNAAAYLNDTAAAPPSNESEDQAGHPPARQSMSHPDCRAKIKTVLVRLSRRVNHPRAATGRSHPDCRAARILNDAQQSTTPSTPSRI